MMESEQGVMFLRATLRSHTHAVTAIAIPKDDPDIIATASHDNSIIVWHLIKEGTTYGFPRRHLTADNHSIIDVALSDDCYFAISASLDDELRLWDIAKGTCIRRFIGHTQGVLSVAFIDDGTIVSSSFDSTIKVWNILGECMHTVEKEGNSDAHSRFVSCVRISPNTSQPTIVSVSGDQTLKLWDSNDFKLKHTLSGHIGPVYTVVVSPGGSLCASGGWDGIIMLWDMDKGEWLYTLNAGTGYVIYALCMCPNRYWICAATEESVEIWDLETEMVIDKLKVDFVTEKAYATDDDDDDGGDNPNNEEEKEEEEKVKPKCTSLEWSNDGSTLYCGYNDGVVRVWGVRDY